MKGLAELIISFFDLLEAEGQLLQRNVLRTLRMALLFALGLLFGAAGLFLWRRCTTLSHMSWTRPGCCALWE